MKITAIHFFGTIEDFSADITIDNKWILQYGNDKKFSIPQSHEAHWNGAEAQDKAFETLEANEVAKLVGALSKIEAWKDDKAFWSL